MNEYSKGSNVIERRYVNKDEDYEVRYAKDKPSRMGYKDERKFAVGGEIGNTVSFKGDYGTLRSGVVKEKRGSSYIVGTDDGDRLVDSYEVISFSETPIAKKKRFGFFEGGGEILATSPSKDGIKKIIEQYLYGSTITLVETDNDKIYEVHNKKGKTPFHVEVIRGRYKFIQTDKPKYAGGGEIENKIEKLKKVVSSKMLPESVKAKAQAEIDKLEKELHESKETKAEEKAEHKAGMDEEKDYVEAKTKALEKSLKDKTISETQRKRDEKELALFKGAEAKKPTTRKATTRKAPVKKAVVKKTEVKAKFKVDDIVGTDKDDALAKKITSFKTNRKGEVIYSGYYISKPSEKFSFEESELVSIKAPAKPKADHKKLVAKLKAKKGGKEYDNRASLVPFTDKRRERSESSDKKRSALPPGKRVSENGVTYYERRLNRTDLSKKDKFEKGGEVKGSDWGLNLNW